MNSYEIPAAIKIYLWKVTFKLIWHVIGTSTWLARFPRTTSPFLRWPKVTLRWVEEASAFSGPDVFTLGRKVSIKFNSASSTQLQSINLLLWMIRHTGKNTFFNRWTPKIESDIFHPVLYIMYIIYCLILSSRATSI